MVFVIYIESKWIGKGASKSLLCKSKGEAKPTQKSLETLSNEKDKSFTQTSLGKGYDGS